MRHSRQRRYQSIVSLTLHPGLGAVLRMEAPWSPGSWLIDAATVVKGFGDAPGSRASGIHAFWLAN